LELGYKTPFSIFWGGVVHRGVESKAGAPGTLISDFPLFLEGTLKVPEEARSVEGTWDTVARAGGGPGKETARCKTLWRTWWGSLWSSRLCMLLDRIPESPDTAGLGTKPVRGGPKGDIPGLTPSWPGSRWPPCSQHWSLSPDDRSSDEWWLQAFGESLCVATIRPHQGTGATLEGEGHPRGLETRVTRASPGPS
jgi:hypothetical protein